MTATICFTIPIEVTCVDALSQQICMLDFDIGFLAARETKPACRAFSVTSMIEHCPVAYTERFG